MSTPARPAPGPWPSGTQHAPAHATRLVVEISDEAEPFAAPLALVVVGLTARQLVQLIQAAVATALEAGKAGEP